jgi:hypothetical protein
MNKQKVVERTVEGHNGGELVLERCIKIVRWEGGGGGLQTYLAHCQRLTWYIHTGAT